MTKRAIILAAGRGTRMTSYASASPKALLEFNGEALLTRQLQSFAEAGVTEFVVVGGYLFDRMRDYVATSRHNITLLYNPFFSVSNSIGSLWFAREYLDESVFITNGDTFFEKSIFNQLESNLNNYILGIDKSKKLDADYCVTCVDDEIVDMGKDIQKEEVTAEYIGIALMRGQGIERFRELLEHYILFENYNLWWEDLFTGLISKREKISFEDVTGKTWLEIDTPRDYRRYQRLF
jgi:choline kinase